MQEKKLTFFEGILVFLCILLKYLITYGISKSVLYAFLIFLIIFLIIDIYKKKIRKNEFIKIIILLSISAYMVILYQDVNFLISLIMAVICIRKDNKNYVKKFLIFSILLYSMTIVLYYIGILESKNLIRLTEDGIVTRYSLGFNHPNEVFLFFIPIALAGYYLYSEKKSFYIIIFIVATILYKLSYSRTGYIVVLFILLIHILYKMKNVKIGINKVLPYMFFIFTIISIGVAIIYGNNNSNYISTALSGRPYYWNYYIENGSILSLLGGNSVNGWNLDNLYIYLLVELGIIGYIVYSLIYYKSLKQLKTKKDNKLLLIIFIFMIYGLTEMNVIIGSINFAFAIQLKSIIENKEEIKNE